MTEKEETLQALKGLLSKQDYSRAAAIIASEKLDQQFRDMNDDLSFEMNAIFAVAHWGNGRFKESLRVCDKMLMYFDRNDEQEFDEQLISGMVRLKHLILTHLGHKLQAYFFLKRNLHLLSEDDAVELRMWYQKSKDYLVDIYRRRIALTFACSFFFYSVADYYYYYYDLVDFPYSIIISIMFFILAMLSFRKTGFVPFILNRIF